MIHSKQKTSNKPLVLYLKQDFCYPPGQAPPLLVKSHGGPTSAAHVTLNLQLQYWTSRGWAVADVNYGGSTGFGRAYRNRFEMPQLTPRNRRTHGSAHLTANGCERYVVRAVFELVKKPCQHIVRPTYYSDVGSAIAPRCLCEHL